MSSANKIQTIAIVGGGFSGTLVAANLLRLDRGAVRIVLIERQPPIGRGVAYRTEEPNHLLNVSAGKMGAWADRPGDFVRWLQQRQGAPGITTPVDPTAFLPRHLYGTYVGDVLAEAVAKAKPPSTFEHVAGEVIDIEEQATGGLLKFADGTSMLADRVVLAVGNLPGEYPIHRALPIYRHARYVHIPWKAGALDGIGANDDVLLVGQGLTATDIVIQLNARGHRGTIHSLSRNGLRPQVHKAVTPHASFLDGESPPPNLRALVMRVRREIREAAAAGVDWRAVVDAIRPQTPTLWQGLSPDDRARFMKYIRPFWEIHRHRLAPKAASVIDEMVEQRRLKFHAGRLQVLEADTSGVQALFRRRGSIQHVSLHVAKVINCTGPRTDYSKYQHPLFIHLLARGLIDHDALALGINALPTGEVLRYRAGPVGWLFTLGAPMKGVLWESTAVPEIRVQAAALAETLLR